MGGEEHPSSARLWNDQIHAGTACQGGSALRRNIDLPDNVLQEETRGSSRTLTGRGKLSSDSVNVLLWKTDLSRYVSSKEGGPFQGAGLSSSKVGVHKFYCKLESPRDLLNFPLSRMHPVKSESLRVGPGH